MGLSLEEGVVILASLLSSGVLAAAETPSMGVSSCTGFALLWGTRVSLRFPRMNWSRCWVLGRGCHWPSLGHLEKGGTRWANQTMLLAVYGLRFDPPPSPEPLNWQESN